MQGTRDYTAQQVADQLGLGKGARPAHPAPGMQQPQQRPGKRFILPLGECEFTITGSCPHAISCVLRAHKMSKSVTAIDLPPASLPQCRKVLKGHCSNWPA